MQENISHSIVMLISKELTKILQVKVHQYQGRTHLLMKSNSEKSSMRAVRSVDMAPCNTGGAMWANDSATRRLLPPTAVRNPMTICRVNSMPSPTAATMKTAGAALKRMPTTPMRPASWNTSSDTERTTRAAAQTFSRTMATIRNTPTTTARSASTRKNLPQEKYNMYLLYNMLKKICKKI